MSQALATLRKQLRQQRRNVSAWQHKQAEQRCLNQLIRLSQFKQAQHIGLYLDAFGEVHTSRMIQYCFKQHKKIYLPQICNMNQRLLWVRLHKSHYDHQRFSLHPLGMQEPKASRAHNVSKLDLLIMPLLACDPMGLRLGMGGGFYDRTLALAPHAPFRMGLAHDFQLLTKHLEAQPWDQGLDALLTPKNFQRFKR